MLKKIVDEKTILNYERVFALLSVVEDLTEIDVEILDAVKGKIIEVEINENR